MSVFRYMFRVVAMLLFAAAVFAIWYVVTFAVDGQRFRWALEQQQATFQRFGDHPPAGLTEGEWRNAIITPYNVWGNTMYELYTPRSSDLARMASLHQRLDEIVLGTTTDNSIESVDKSFDLLLTFSRNIEFVERHRDSFRQEVNELRTKVRGP